MNSTFMLFACFGRPKDAIAVIAFERRMLVPLVLLQCFRRVE